MEGTLGCGVDVRLVSEPKKVTCKECLQNIDEAKDLLGVEK